MAPFFQNIINNIQAFFSETVNFFVNRVPNTFGRVFRINQRQNVAVPGYVPIRIRQPRRIPQLRRIIQQLPEQQNAIQAPPELLNVEQFFADNHPNLANNHHNIFVPQQFRMLERQAQHR